MEYIPLNLIPEESSVVAFESSIHDMQALEKAIREFLVEHNATLSEYLVSRRMAKLPKQALANPASGMSRVMANPTNGWCYGKIRTRIIMEFCPDDSSEWSTCDELVEAGSSEEVDQQTSPLDGIRKVELENET